MREDLICPPSAPPARPPWPPWSWSGRTSPGCSCCSSARSSRTFHGRILVKFNRMSYSGLPRSQHLLLKGGITVLIFYNNGKVQNSLWPPLNPDKKYEKNAFIDCSRTLYLLYIFNDFGVIKRPEGEWVTVLVTTLSIHDLFSILILRNLCSTEGEAGHSSWLSGWRGGEWRKSPSPGGRNRGWGGW